MPIGSMAQGSSILERKIRYDATVVDHHCKLLKAEGSTVILAHQNERSFSMKAGVRELTISKGVLTFAYYWIDQPYNLYYWKDLNGNELGAYFNIVRNTHVSEEAVSFEDLIIDLLVLPGGDYYILDEDELPEPLHQFEDGFVQKALQMLLDRKEHILREAAVETERLWQEMKGLS
ncbi:DUF402 domain-containing protein [Paenibacillus lactis]|uniref:DUF402 domain-containing protein n=2 Tax=Paenibacillus lactis TaxID=228574 RepID=G4HAP5_9BACL|nr:DUF402 domain-containing protein [Paenibacillus lactis]EHB67004.1 protein of unknown function DUF402 [Paenibacillus lactis 154]MBP1895046.1 putative RNA-binding protein associated with RNAse of E/G family [Paenibacillus lactis]MCM3496812.1 DUF402 domain-containing protein [Paenibacillus lactis]